MFTAALFAAVDTAMTAYRITNFVLSPPPVFIFTFQHPAVLLSTTLLL
jgi:hypothetical protein